MLLATSMVLSSVSVASFADDEIIFEPEVSVTTEAGEDEAYFGEEEGAVVDEQTATDDEAFFSDEVIDETVNDDVITEDENIADTADEAVDYAFEEGTADEPIVDENADIYAAIENAEQTASDEVSYDITGDMSYNKAYDGEAHGLDKTKAGVPADEIRFRHPEKETLGEEGMASTAYEDMVWEADSPTYTHVNAPSNTDLGKEVIYQTKVWNADKSAKIWPTTYAEHESQYVRITRATATATLKDKTYNVNDATPTLTYADFEFSGLKGTDTAEKLFTVGTNGAFSVGSSGNYDVSEWNGAKWVKVESDADIAKIISGDKFIKAGRYTFTLKDGKASTAFTEKTAGITGKTTEDYSFAAVNGGEFTIAGKQITVTWPDNLKYDGKEQTYEPKATGYVFDPAVGTTDKGTNVDTYTYTIGKVYKGTTAADKTEANDVTNSVTVTNPTHEWAITKATIYAFVKTSQGSLNSFEYGTKDPVALYKLDNIVFSKKKDNTAAANLVEGVANTLTSKTPVFETTYSQYDPVYSFDGTTTTKANYFVRYKSGLESKNYEILVGNDYDPTASTHLVDVENYFTLTPAYVKVVPNNVTVAYGADPVEPTYSIENVNKDSGAAAALQHDIDAKKVNLSVYTIEKPGTDGQDKRYDAKKTTEYKAKTTYYFGWKLEDATKNSGANRNFVEFNADKTYKTGVTNSTIDLNRKYVVNEGEFTIKFSDYEGVYDGKAHGIVVEPDPLPSNVTVYYAPKTMSGTEADANYYKKIGSTTPITYVDAMTEPKLVYYYVVSDGYGSGLSGSNKVMIKDADKAAAQAVEKQIEDATKKDAEGKYDPAKVKAAREAYDALTNDQKAMVSAYDVKALKEAEAAIAESAEADAKAVEEQIAKLPVPEKVTEADKEAIEAAKKAYDALSDDAKAKVSKDAKDKLDADIAAIEGEEEADKKAAKAVEDEIDALPEAGNVTAADKAAVDKAVADLDALTDAQKALVPAEKKEKLAMVKAAADKAAEEDEKAEKERELFDEAVALVKAQKNGVDGKNAADNAKKAYENLSDAAKAKLTDEEIDAYEDTQKAYAKNFTFNSGEGVFKVLGNGEVTYFKPLHPENTWFVVPNMVKKNGFVYKVIKVSTKAFMGCVNAKKIKIGKNVQVMGEYVFKNTPAMGKLIMLTSKLASGKVKNTFVAGGKNGGAKLTNYVPSGKSSAYDSLFKGEGGMNAKAKFTEEN